MTYVHYHIYYSKLNSYVTTIFYIYFIKFKLLCVTILSVTTFLVLTLMFNLAPTPIVMLIVKLMSSHISVIL